MSSRGPQQRNPRRRRRQQGQQIHVINLTGHIIGDDVIETVTFVNPDIDTIIEWIMNNYGFVLSPDQIDHLLDNGQINIQHFEPGEGTNTFVFTVG